jgi:hypothetical protein
MSTVRDLIERAHRRLGEVGFGQAMTPERADHGLNCLNEMCHGWKAENVDIGFTDKALNDPFFLGSEYFGGVAALLAVRLAEDYGNNLSQLPSILRDATTAWRSLQAAYIQAPAADIDRALQNLPSQRRYGWS